MQGKALVKGQGPMRMARPLLKRQGPIEGQGTGWSQGPCQPQPTQKNAYVLGIKMCICKHICWGPKTYVALPQKGIGKIATNHSLPTRLNYRVIATSPVQAVRHFVSDKLRLFYRAQLLPCRDPLFSRDTFWPIVDPNFQRPNQPRFA